MYKRKMMIKKGKPDKALKDASSECSIIDALGVARNVILVFDDLPVWFRTRVDYLDLLAFGTWDSLLDEDSEEDMEVDDEDDKGFVSLHQLLSNAPLVLCYFDDVNNRPYRLKFFTTQTRLSEWLMDEYDRDSDEIRFIYDNLSKDYLIPSWQVTFSRQ